MSEISDEVIQKITAGFSGAKRDAVLSKEPYLRIVASAGAGKTETITRRIIYLCASGTEPKSIVAFTFTEKAAQEMKERIYRRIEEILGEEKVKKLGDMFIGTIHGFCFQLLQDHFGYGNYEVLDDNQEMAFVMRHGWGLGLHDGGDYATNCERFIRSINVVFDELIDPSSLDESAPEFAQHLAKYTEKLRQHRLLTFGTMIYRAVNCIGNDPGVLSHIEHLVVDEYQDINKAQERLIWQIAKFGSCFIVGDPRQCIYEWRGSAPECFDRFSEMFRCETVTISENRRSVNRVVSVGNAIASNFRSDMLRTPMAAKRKDNGTVLSVIHDYPDDEARWISYQIRRLIDEKICIYSDIAILLRSVSTSGPVIAEELKKSGIPYIVGGRIGLFQRDEAQAVGRVFAWIAGMHWALNRWGKERLEGQYLIESAQKLWRIPISAQDLEEFSADILSGRFKCLTDAYQHLLIHLGFLKLDPFDQEEAVIIANLGRFNTLLVDFESAQRRGGRKPEWRKDLVSLVWFMNSYALGAYEEQPSDDLQGVDAIQLYTVHQAKGLEWPVVFVPAVTGLRFPSKQAGKAREWDIPERMFDVKRYQGSVESERKLFYVATTRARDALVISSFRRINRTIPESRFLAESGIQLEEPRDQIVTDRVFPRPFDDEAILTFNPGELIEYLRCPHFYRMRELWGYKPLINELLGYGRSVHHIIRTVTEGVLGGQDPYESLDRAIEEEFHLPYADQGTLAMMRQNAKKVILKYLKGHLEEIKSTKAVESRLEFKLSQRATIAGRIDAIFGNDGGVEVRDYKTDHDARTESESSLQLRLYSLGLRELGHPVNKASLAVISRQVDAIFPIDVSHSSLLEARFIAKNAIQRLIDRKFNPNCGEYCESCDYSKICHFTKPLNF